MVRLVLLPIFLLVSSTIARCPALSIPPRARLAHLSSSEGNVSFEWNFPYQPTTEETERRNPVSCCNGTIDTRNTSQNSTESDVPMVVDNEGHHQPCVNRSIKKLLSERNYSVKTQHFLPASHPLEEPKSNLNSPEEENWMEKPKVNSLHKSYIYLGPQIYPFSFKESRVVVSKSDRRSRIQSSDGTEEKPPVKTWIIIGKMNSPNLLSVSGRYFQDTALEENYSDYSDDPERWYMTKRRLVKR